MHSKKLRKVFAAAIAVLLLSVSVGCGASGNKLYVVDQEDIWGLAEGQQFTAPKDGWFVSDRYLAEIAGVDVEELS